MGRDHPLILAIAQGTTNTKATLVSAEGEIRAEGSVSTELSFPAPGWVESDGRAIWDSVQAATERCLRQAPGAPIVAVGIANQRESVLVWDRATGELLGPCISWQCRRTAAYCDRLRAQGHEPRVHALTGLGLDPLFSASKARWLLDHIDDGDVRGRRGELCIGTVDSWIVWNLTAGRSFVTDLTNASRTLLLDLDRGCWDEGLLDLFRIPIEALPVVRGSSGHLGTTRAIGPIPGGIPIAAMAGDSHAALFGHGAPASGTVKVTYGTGSSVMTPLERRVRAKGLSETIAWSVESRDGGPVPSIVHALEGNITATGATLAWLTTLLGLQGVEHELERLAASVPEPGGVYLVPAFAGLGAPHWDPDARGLICGLTRGTRPAHVALAGFESIAYQVRDVIEALGASAPTAPSMLIADGGAMRSDLLAQIQADVVRLPVLRSRSGSVAALGAAYLAGLAVGTWGSINDVRRLPRAFERFEPGDRAEARERGYRGWAAALARAAGGGPHA
jgi:glycerol kinase